MYEDVSGGICVPSRFTFGSLLEKQSAVLGPPFFIFLFLYKIWTVRHKASEERRRYTGGARGPSPFDSG